MLWYDLMIVYLFFFKQKTAYEVRISDWSSDVCSSDLKALSIDNIFVISLIFAAFAIPARYQYRALLWGIIAVIVLRGIMIAGGSALVTEYGWLLYVFAAFLVFTGIKMLFASEKPMDVAEIGRAHV